MIKIYRLPVAETGAGFGYKIEWLAVHLQSAETVAAALGLGRLSPATWQDAVAAAYADRWLLTPPIDGWTLAASRSMPTPEPDLFEPWLAQLSASLGRVQYFGTNRAVDYHAWARARGGVMERAFGYLGGRDQALFDIGERTPEEQSLGVGFIPDDDWWESEEDEDTDPLPDEEAVLALAGHWGVDPRRLESADIAGLPWIGGRRVGSHAL
jgi:hypothetical protein